jgi:hypothetical protein
MPWSLPSPQRVCEDEMPALHPHAAGMDSGARAMVVAVPPERDAEPVRVLATLTPALHALGLLQGSFRPEAARRVWRTLLAHRAPHILPMPKARTLLHLPLSEVEKAHGELLLPDPVCAVSRGRQTASWSP